MKLALLLHKFDPEGNVKKIFLLIFVLSAFLLNGKIEILEQSRERSLITISVQGYQIHEDRNFTYINLENWTNTGEIGAPALPNKFINIAVPPQGNISVNIIYEKTSIKYFRLPLQPVPRIIKSGETSDFIFEIDEELFSRGSDRFLVIGEKLRFRFNEYFPVKISPFLYDHSARKLEIIEELILEINIEGDHSFRNEIPDKFDRIYEDFFINYNSSKSWKTKSDRKINSMPFSDSGFWYRIEVEDEGICGLFLAELSQLPDFVESDSVRIFRGIRKENLGEKERTEFLVQEIPIFIESGNDGRFDEEDFVLFSHEILVDDIHHRYSGKTVFWLTFGGEYHSKPARSPDLRNIDNILNVSDFNQYSPPETNDRDRQVDCLMISPSVFISQSEELAQIHLDNYGLSSEIIDQQTTFDLYGESPQGLKDYIEVYFNDHPELEVVILMGSGTTNWELNIEKNKIIVYENDSHYAYDDFFIAFGSSEPDLPIGRIPAQNTSQMDLMIGRLRDYIETPNLGWWRNKVLIVADDENKSGGLEGTGGLGLNHTYQAQYTGEILSNGVYVDKLLAIEYDMDEFLLKPEVRDETIDRINEGRLIWYYIGHGADDILGDEGYFRGSLHIRFLENEEHLTLFIAASCNVGQFDDSAFDCLGEKLLFHDYGGSIATIAASRSCGGSANTTLIRHFFDQSLNERENIGWALWDAKLYSGATSSNSRLYHVLGDPLLQVLTPEISGSMTIDEPIADSLLQARQTVFISGDYELENAISGVGEIRIYNTEDSLNYHRELNGQVYDVDYTRNGSCFFKGSVQTENNEFDAGFIIPDDVQNGERGRFISYISDNIKSDFTSYLIPVKYSEIAVPSINNDAPSVQLWIDSKKFLSGDYVSTEPTLIAAISDSNGINISGSAGHKILLLLDQSNDPLDVTEHFFYDIDSYTNGELLYELDEIAVGRHTLQLIVFDNFNVPTVASTEFIARESGKVAIEQMLPYPNPMKNEGYFTFIITEDADVEIMIYTITSRKIRTLKKQNCGAGYNQVFWDTKDTEGDHIANNTYFYKIKAKQLSDGNISEKTGKVIILK